jgi:shikimate dehydrogenase
MKRFAVFGKPISQSKSPQIHALFAAQFGIALTYTHMEADQEQFETALAKFANAGGVGANVTSPLKEKAFALCASVDERARIAGAVNTLIRRDQHWYGANTDGIGLMRDLTERHGLVLHNKRLLMIGAGGAARGVLGSFLAAGVGEVVIANRTHARAESLASLFSSTTSAKLCAVDLAELETQGAFDLIVHASSAGNRAEAFKLPVWPISIVHGRSFLVDLSYGVAAAPALAFASELEIQAVDGLGMLIEQAAEAFFLWHGVRPNTAPVWAALRAEA